MKKYVFLTLILFFVVSSSGCTNLGGNNQTSPNSTYQITEKDLKTSHYNDNDISFDYPNTWTIKVSNYSISLFNYKKQVTIENPGINTAFVENNSKNISANAPPRREVVSNRTINIDGLDAQEITYQNVGDMGPSRIEVVINKNSEVFKIYFYATPEEFNSAKADLNIIINSLKIK